MAKGMFRPFDKADWDAFGGAEPFGNGDDPMIYDDYEDYVIIYDGNGLTGYDLSQDGEAIEEFNIPEEGGNVGTLLLVLGLIEEEGEE